MRRFKRTESSLAFVCYIEGNERPISARGEPTEMRPPWTVSNTLTSNRLPNAEAAEPLREMGFANSASNFKLESQGRVFAITTNLLGKEASIDASGTSDGEKAWLTQEEFLQERHHSRCSRNATVPDAE
ncbi:hypothetical protein V5799_023017 [Amblyomma americanum]|uniref:Uncharacterized protein n=1 Tax=Amblyomma americanum TaxID=6943 RepID=A0AAQ4FKC7_AMBAM